MTSPCLHAAGWLLVVVTAMTVVGHGDARGDDKAGRRGRGDETLSRDAGVRPAMAAQNGNNDVKHDGKNESKSDSKNGKSSAGPQSTAPLPPSLTATALRDELARSGHDGSPLSDQQRLETLAAELVKAREALRAETTRLEALMRTNGALGPGGPSGRDGPGAPAWESSQGGAAPRSEPRRASGQLEVIAKAFKGMKPEQAAAVISQLDRSLAAEVLLRMRPADAGAVLGLLRPELGAALATEIARQPAPSKPRGTAGGAP